MPVKEEAVVGCVLGTAVGDALGLPAERLSPRRARLLLGPISRHRFILGRGMVSDDTQHACLTAQALVRSAGDDELFCRELAARLRWWLLSLPAGAGWATLRAAVRLSLGCSGRSSGVPSAGNGAAMRAPLIGVCYGAEPDRLRALVRTSTRLTHTDPEAEWGALAVAVAAHMSAAGETAPDQYLARLRAAGLQAGPGAQRFWPLMERAAQSATAGRFTVDFAVETGSPHGVSGYVLHTVPVVIQCWLRHPRDFRTAMETVISCGGDTDTTAAILGGIVGAGTGLAGIPREWTRGLLAWPCGVSWMAQLGSQLTEVCNSGRGEPPMEASFPAQVLRNLFFLAVVLGHGLRRLLPPY